MIASRGTQVGGVALEGAAANDMLRPGVGTTGIEDCLTGCISGVSFRVIPIPTELFHVSKYID
jgi:hypothetical protein